MMVIVKGLLSGLVITKGYSSSVPVVTAVYPDPSLSTWSVASNRPDPARSTSVITGVSP
jgi:hypothetical protein